MGHEGMVRHALSDVRPKGHAVAVLERVRHKKKGAAERPPLFLRPPWRNAYGAASSAAVQRVIHHQRRTRPFD
jgi:hypothetical protein